MLIYFDSNFKTESSDNGREATPVPIPNTEVKLSSANGTWLETAWESKTLLDLLTTIHTNCGFLVSKNNL